jgi:hypothetical protein
MNILASAPSVTPIHEGHLSHTKAASLPNANMGKNCNVIWAKTKVWTTIPYSFHIHQANYTGAIQCCCALLNFYSYLGRLSPASAMQVSVSPFYEAFFCLALSAFFRLLLIMTTERKLPTTVVPRMMRMTGMRMAQTRGRKRE